MKDKKNILIIILSILLVITVGYIVYSELNSKNIDNCSKTENNNIENNNSNKNNENNQNQTSGQSEYNIVGEAYNGIKVIKNTNNDILYILVTTKNWYYHSESFNNYYSYYYDMKNDKELTTNEVASILNIKLKDIKNAKEITNIMYINNYKQAKIYYKELEDKCSNEECKNETTIDLKT